MYRRVPVLRFSANKSSDLGQKGRGGIRRERESRIAQTLRFLLKLRYILTAAILDRFSCYLEKKTSCHSMTEIQQRLLFAAAQLVN